MNEKKIKILEYVESRMSYVAPNLSVILGSTIAAKVMGKRVRQIDRQTDRQAGVREKGVDTSTL